MLRPLLRSKFCRKSKSSVPRLYKLRRNRPQLTPRRKQKQEAPIGPKKVNISKHKKAAAAAEKARITAMLDQARNPDAKSAQQQLVVPGAANATADVTAAEAKSVALDKEEGMIEASGKSDALKLDAENAKIAMTMESTRNLKVCPMCCADCALCAVLTVPYVLC